MVGGEAMLSTWICVAHAVKESWNKGLRPCFFFDDTGSNILCMRDALMVQCWQNDGVLFLGGLGFFGFVFK